MAPFLCLLALLSTTTITIPMRRNLPPHVQQQFPQLAASEERTLPLKVIGCDGKAALRALRYSLAFTHDGQKWVMEMAATAELEKIAKGPLYPPTLTLGGAHDVTFAFESAMASPRWEEGGTFTEAFYRGEMLDGKEWTSIALHCSDDSPYHAAVIPGEVVYKRADRKIVEQAVKKLEAALRSDKAFGTASLYDPGVMIIGPDLYARIKSDPALQKTSSPAMVTVDPASGASRGMLRIKGAEEAEAFGQAMRRYLGDAKPRIRAATSVELARYWLNIGWDIEEPLLIADYGTHRIVIDFNEDGTALMVDEIAAGTATPTSGPRTDGR